MKMSALLFVGLCCALTGSSQTCKLTGIISDPQVKTVQLYPLYADGAYSTALFTLTPDQQGRFSQTIPLSQPVFAQVKWGEKHHRIFISPGRDLQLSISAKAISFQGKAAVENQLVQTSVLNNEPFFMKGGYLQISPAGWKDSILDPIALDVATTHARIEQAAIPGALKWILIRETRYAYQCYLSDLTRGDLRRAKNPHADTLQKLVMQWQPVPDSIALQSGFYANLILERHGHYALNELARDKSGGREAMFDRIGSFLGMPFPTIDSLIRRYGERPVLPWLYARRHLPASIRDKILYNLLLEAGDGVNLPACRLLLQQLQQQFPGSQYLDRAKAVVQQMETTVQQNLSNTRIVIKDTGNTASVLALMKNYVGKVVYLDVWGTWCGPCRNEVPFTAGLKKRYEGKNIVFVYVALDNPNQDKLWREYVQLNNLEGDHYRINRKLGNQFWSDARAAGVADLQSVPRYMIFDAQGKLVHGEAARPSSEQKLYDQLDKLL